MDDGFLFLLANVSNIRLFQSRPLPPHVFQISRANIPWVTGSALRTPENICGAKTDPRSRRSGHSPRSLRKIWKWMKLSLWLVGDLGVFSACGSGSGLRRGTTSSECVYGNWYARHAALESRHRCFQWRNLQIWESFAASTYWFLVPLLISKQ